MPGVMSEGNVEQGYRLSPPQKRLCALQQDGGDRRYGARCAILIEGPLDTELLDRALQGLIERHDSLRTTFVRPPGLKLPVQIVAEAAALACERLDLRRLDARQQEEEIERLFHDEQFREFDPGRGSLLRATLLSLADDRYALLISLPALCADSRTLSNIVTHLASAYAACAEGVEPPEMALQYLQFSEWQNEILSDEDASEGEAFWRARAARAAAAPLPFGARPAAARPAYEVFNSFVAPETAASVRRAAERYGTTTEVFLLACWQTLLWRLTGQPEVAVGVMCDGRKFEDLNDSLGLFARWLPFTATFRRELPFSEVLLRASEDKSEAEEWQEYFIWHERQEDGRSARPYPEIGFEYTQDGARHTGAGVRFSTLRQYACTDRADLKLHVADAGERLATEFHYDAALFEAADIERLSAQVRTLLASAAADPETPVGRLEILDDEQRRQVLREFNQTAANYPTDKCLHELVEAQAASTPDASALVFEGECVTYAELNTRANQLAHRLLRLGVGPETLVGICLERSSEVVVGALGVLKAGAAYVPLDPEYPAERLSYMLEDARVSVLLTSARLARNLPEHSAHTILLDADRDSLARESRHNPPQAARPDNLAYVIYTSGSTGRPKGTMNTHRGVCNRQLWMQEVYALTPSDRVLQLSSFSFDFSVWEFWGTLSAGATLVLPRPGGQRESAYLRRLIDEQGVTTAHFVPSMLQVFLEEIGPGDCLSLRRVFVGGEALSRELHDRFLSRMTASLHNQYGPTEASIDVTYWDCRRDGEPGLVPIGRPNANNAIYIVDPEGRPVPVAASGELHIGGVAVGRGYFNRPDLTAEKFIPDPFSAEPGARLYRTGDLARYHSDGRIDYLGRIDEQVKVRGFRIELGEVEATLESHPLVREAVVVPQQSPSGDMRLVGFVVCTRPQAVSAADLRAYAEGKLPGFMIPALVVELDRMPLTGSGKADRRALAQTTAVEERAEEETAPRTLVEELVCGIWAEVLGLERVGITDNFFALGGHSLLATRVASRVREAFSVELELRELFDAPTVETLGSVIEGRLSAGAGPGAPPLRRVESEGALPLSFAQQRLWFIEQMRSGGATYNLPAAFKLKGELNVAALEQTLNEITRRHESLRTVFEMEQGRPHQVVKDDGRIGLVTADLRWLDPRSRAEQVRTLTAEEAGRGFDLGAGPLVRAQLLTVADDEHVLLLTMHHIVSDGWSLGLFIRETGELYAAYESGRPSPLAELPVQYADFARWQREWLSAETLERQLEYWREQLKGARAPELPTDRPRPTVQTHSGAREAIEIDAELSEKLRQLSRREGVTLFMTLLAAFEVLLHRYSGQREIVVGTPIAGRNHKEIEGLIGFFVNTLVLRAEVRGDDSYRELLKATREVMLGAYAHQDVPFEKLVEELQPQRDLSRSPLFQVMFSFQPPAGDAIELRGLTVEAEPVENSTAKFDLTVALKDGEQGLSGELEYNTDLFDPETARRIVRHFRTLLESIAERPEQKVSEVVLLTEGDRAEILSEWNQTAVEYPPSECVHELIAEQAHRTPDRVAVVSSAESVSYRQLEKKSNQLANYLVARGVGPEVRVGVCVERGVEMLVALLGILKAGGAYVPLDPGYPKERLAYMVEDSQLAVLLTEESLRGHLPDCAGEVVRLDAQREEIAREDERPVAARVGGDNVAYVIYTSGSTGRPKGVMISHRALVNLLNSMSRQPGLSEGDVLLAVTSISFDIAALELFLPLTVGARVRVADRRTAADGEALRRELIGSGATVMQATPTTWRVLLESGWRNETRIKAISGGEPLPEKLAHELSELTPSLWNVYGPTETTIWSTVLRVEGPGAVTIGRPVANTQVYILGEGWQPTPVGVAGHLLIGGDGLARGYHLRPDLTAERFVPDPFGGRAGARLYQAGDLARYRPDGRIEFLGRDDQQVKIRGYRIEAGDVEAALNRHPGVRASVVAPFAGVSGELRLAAYLLSDDPQGLETVELRRFLKAKLPEYMIPAAFVLLEDFPRTPNGKIDRKALPAPEPAKTLGGRDSLAPRTPIEEELVRIWTELLGAEPASVDDNFFELGGYSLLAMQLNHRLRETFRLDIPLVALFESPTIAELAVEVARRRAEQGDSRPPALVARAITPDPANRYEPFPLNDVQQAYWIGREGSFELGGVASHSYTEIDFLVLDVERLGDALRRVIERHDMLRAVVLSDGTQRVLKDVPPYRIADHDLSARSDHEVEAHLRSMRQRMSHEVLPTDRWPLFDVHATRLPGGRVRLHFSLDYLIVDAWSLGLVFGEIFKLYERPELNLPAPALSFRDFVLAELAERETEAYREAERYWLSRLPTLPPAPELPLAVSPETLHKPRFVRRDATLGRDRWERIKAHGLRHGLTPTAILLGAFSEILAAWSKSPRFTVNLTIFNRPPVHPEILDIVGDFTSLTLLEVDGGRAGSFGLRARAIQEQLWNDLERRAVSGIRVQRELARTQSKQATSIMPVVFTSTLGQRDQDIDPTAGGQARPDLSDKVYTITQTPQVWLDHQVGEVGGELLFNWDAVEDLFFPGVLDDMWHAYNRLLDSLCEESAWQQAPRGWLPETQEALRNAVNATEGAMAEGLLHTAFVRQAELQPNEPAVIGVDRTLTYGELNEWTTALARRLQHLGARPNRLVAVVMEKGWEQVVAVLAILKAGAAYLPVDAGLPGERLRYLLEHGEVSVALTQPWVLPRVEWPAGVTTLTVDDEAPLVGDLGELADPLVEPTDLAYVIFTSGSTGQPKGVMIDHRGALNTVVDINGRFGVTASDRTLALSALNFDLSVYDIFGLLAVGGAIVMPAATGSRDPEHWLELVREHRVTVWNTVPALMEMLAHLVGENEVAAAPTLRLVMLSGDWIPVSLPERVRAVSPGAQVVSLGGATEASIWSILYEIGEVDPGWRSIPYGHPMLNQRFYVLNEQLEECPDWVTGQLHIGGVGLAKGYWKDEEKTARSFILHPRTGERLYRTGDMGRYLPDGEIEFLGREDTQVKVEGHRIELGEVEAALEAHERVRGAVALAVGSQRTNRRLIAYITLDGELPEADRMLREYVRTKLPHYMVPQSISVIESLPLTANGKVDRRALAMLDVAPAAPEAHRDYVAPRTPLEEKVAGIWAEILGADRVGAHDSFFDLGGNSLAAIRIITRLRDTFGVEVPLRQLFQRNTVADVAEILGQLEDRKEQERAAAFRSYEIEPDPASRYEPFPLNDVQHAYWIGRNQFFELGSVAAHGYAEYEFRQLDLARLETAIQRLIERHDMLRAVVLPDGRQQVLESVPPYRLEPVDLRGRPPEEVSAWLEATRERMSHQVLSLSSWPLFDMATALLDDGRVRLHLGIDIIIIDAWSSRVLAYELGVLYNDPEATLPSLELSFRDYILAERAFQSSPLYQQSANYWKKRLDQLPAAPDLPMLKSPAQVQAPRFVRREARLEAERWRRLKARAARAQLTPSALLLAAFGETLALWSKHPNFTINLTLFNRLPLHPQVNDIIGDFTSIILVPVDTSGDGSFEERAGRLQSQLLEILENRYMSGVAVLRELSRSHKRAPGALTPIVFTSNLFGDSSGEENGDGPGAGGLLAERVYAVSQTPQVWLDHQAVAHGGVLDFSWDVVEELFPEGLFDDIFESYFRLLCSLADSEEAWREQSRPALPFHQARQRQEVNATEVAMAEGLLHTAFVKQAGLQPNEPAVIGVDRTLTYGELDEWTTALALRLQHLGARPNRLVAVVMEKGWEQVVAVLAILKAGAAYLPVDAGLPSERLRYLLEHGEVSVALTQPWVLPRVEWPAGVTTLTVDDEAPPVGDLAELADPLVEPTDLAYVIFTSGSTGQPKGVMIDHRGALNTVVDINGRFGVTAADRTLALSALNFDLSVYDIFGLLAVGGAIVMPAATGSRDPEHWLELVREHRVTVWNTVPALMEMLAHLVGESEVAAAPTLRLVMLSGDWIPVSLPERVRAVSPGAQVVSLGGATEASIWSILYEIGEVDPGWRSIPYGHPMLNQRFYVLNEQLKECPDWVTGQLHIGGVGLAKGYWKDEEKTARSFILHPRTGEQLYRTGDMGRYLPDGEIEFLGREDTQVKVEGHRIELGEVEAALEAHERVRGAVALAVGSQRTNRHLVAYVVLNDEQGEDAKEVADSFAAALPIPSLPPHESPNGHEARAHNGNGDLGTPLPLGHDGNGASVSPSSATARLAPEDLGSLLARLSQIRLDEQPLPKYQYPSAGNLYPVQTYVLVMPGGVVGIEAGFYYYDPRAHRLRCVGGKEQLKEAAFAPAHVTTLEESAFALFMVARMDAIVPIYGEMSPDFCVLEAGYMGRLLTAAARAVNLGIHQLTRIDFSSLRESFDVDERHVLVHALAVGRPGAPADDAGAPPVFALPALAGTPNASVVSEAATAWGQMADLTERHAARAQTLSKIESLEFKLREAGLRQDAAGENHLALWKPQADHVFIEEFTYRRSDREFLSRPVALEPLTELLELLTHTRAEQDSLLCGLRPLTAEQYPLQTYVYVKAGRVEGLAGGLYHHERHSGALKLLTAGVEIDSSLHAEPNRAIADQSAFMLMFVADIGKAAAFGEWARDICLLEAGYAGQTLLTDAPARGLGLCPVGWVDFERLRRHLPVDDGQVLVHSFLGGAIEPRPRPGHAAPADISHPEGTRRQKSSAGLRQDAATTEEVRAFLGRKLPDYMIPRVILLLDELPLSSNGKVDRNALAALAIGATGSGADAVAPRNPVEQQLAVLWQDLLGVEGVGMHDTFFSLGGDSVTAIRFLARAREAGLEISLPYFFGNPTIARLAEAAQPAEADTAPAQALELAHDGLYVTDFPDANLTQEELDQLIEDFEVPE